MSTSETTNQQLTVRRQEELLITITEGIIESLRDSGSNLRSSAFSQIVPWVRKVLEFTTTTPTAVVETKCPECGSWLGVEKIEGGQFNCANCKHRWLITPAERPTPITDAVVFKTGYHRWSNEWQKSHADLERQLAERTEQRDRLAEALRFYMSICGNTAYSGTRESAQLAHDMGKSALATLNESGQ